MQCSHAALRQLTAATSPECAAAAAKNRIESMRPKATHCPVNARHGFALSIGAHEAPQPPSTKGDRHAAWHGVLGSGGTGRIPTGVQMGSPPVRALTMDEGQATPVLPIPMPGCGGYLGSCGRPNMTISSVSGIIVAWMPTTPVLVATLRYSPVGGERLYHRTLLALIVSDTECAGWCWWLALAAYPRVRIGVGPG